MASLREQLTSVTIHRTDELPHDWRIAHPLASVTLVNGHTGQYLRKSDPTADVTTPNERRGPGRNLASILPMMTKPFLLRGASARLPSWEEELIFKESFAHLLHPRVFAFFELLDFAPDAPDAGLRPFAWGYLKLVSGPMNTDTPTHANVLRPMPLRLQLFQWQKGLRPPNAGQPAVWAQYRAAGRQKYSSSLYATLRPLAPPEKLPVRFPHRPMAVHHVEEGRIPYEMLVQETQRGRDMPSMVGLSIDGGATSAIAASIGDGSAPWTAMIARGASPCQLPNAPLHALAAGSLGATAIALSPDGSLVAIALADEGYSMLVICDVFSGRRHDTFHAHHRTIHELCWLPDGERVASVSADGTAKVWKPGRASTDGRGEDEDEPLTVLPHPSYVYCVRAQPRNPAAPRGVSGINGPPSLLVTGANDNALRIWDVSGDKAELLVTKFGHKARINSVAWPTEGSLFSADGAGVVKSWEVVGRLAGGAGADLKPISSIEKKELRDCPINSVTPHPTRRTRLLLQTRKSQLLALDHRMQHFSTRYVGHRSEAYHIRAAYSPDGRFVVAGSEDGRFYAWAEDTGDMLVDGLNVGFSGPLLQISWSQQHHVLAMCGFGPNNPALLYYWDKDVAATNPLLAAAAAAASATVSSTQQPGNPGASAADVAATASVDAGAKPMSAVEREAMRQARRGARGQRRGNLSGVMNAAAMAGAQSPPGASSEGGRADRKAAAAEARAQASSK